MNREVDRKNGRQVLLAGSAAIALISTSGTAQAQPETKQGAAAGTTSSSAGAQPAPTSSAASSPENVDAIIVTARKRAENAQTVPVSLQVVTGAALEERNLNSLKNLSETVPGLHIESGFRSDILVIRGISAGDNQAFDQAVSTFVDDVYHGRSRVSSATFLDLDRVEVLKGPQSTFFGNNAIAGALNIVTKKPGDRLEAMGRALYGTHDQYALEGAVGGPVTDTLGIRVAATYNGTRGWIENITDPAKPVRVPNIRNLAGRVTLAFRPSDDFDATFKVEASEHRTRGTTGDLPVQWTQCPSPAPYSSDESFSGCDQALALGFPIGLSLNKTAGGEPQDTFSRLRTLDNALTLNYRFAGMTLTSVSAYSGYDFRSQQNLSPAVDVTVFLPEKYHQFSQELRLTSPVGKPIEYTAGLYYQNDRLTEDQRNNFYFLTPVIQFLAGGPLPDLAPLVPYLPLAYRNGVRQNEQVYSAFGSVTWNINDRLKLSAGLRGSTVKKQFVAHFFWGTAGAEGTPAAATQFTILPPEVENVPLILFGGAIPSIGTSPELHQSSKALMPSVNVQYRLASDTMLYARYDRGFLAGGFNGADIYDFSNINEFSPEHVDAFEVGLKSSLFDHKLRFNIDLFSSRYQDLQVPAVVFAPPLFPGGPSGFHELVANAASTSTRGVELEVLWRAAPDIRLGANINYLDSHYTRYTNSPPQTLQSFCTTHLTDPACASFLPGPVSAFADISGQPTTYSPKWSGSLSAEYSHTLNGGYRISAEVDPYFTTKYFVGNGSDPFGKIPGYVRWDARLTLESPDGRWALDVLGKNLSNKVIVATAGLAQGAKQEPRNVAVQLRLKY